MIGAVIMWNRPEPVRTTEAEEEAFEQEHGLPVRTDGGRTLATWGMGLAILVGAIAFGTALLGYFYLRIENETWPPDGIADPGLVRPFVGAAAIVASAVVMARAHRAVRQGSFTSLRAGLAVSAALLLVGGARAAVRPVDDVVLGPGPRLRLDLLPGRRLPAGAGPGRARRRRRRAGRGR